MVNNERRTLNAQLPTSNGAVRILPQVLSYNQPKITSQQLIRCSVFDILLRASHFRLLPISFELRTSSFELSLLPSSSVSRTYFFIKKKVPWSSFNPGIRPKTGTWPVESRRSFVTTVASLSIGMQSVELPERC